MKVLIIYNDENYLVPLKNDGPIDYDRLVDLVNRGRWPDEFQDKDSIIEQSKIIDYFTDESELIS